MYKVVKKLYSVKQTLVQWQRTQPTVSTRIRLAREDLWNIQSKLALHPNHKANIQDEKAARDHLQKQLLIEESLLKQKSRDRDLNLRKMNTKYFYSLVQVRKRRTLITSIKGAEGKVYNQPYQIKEVFINHFKKILASSQEDSSLNKDLLGIMS